MKKLLCLLAVASLFSAFPADARVARSATAKRQFARMQACPATGKNRISCPGFEIDHIVPLKCGGADSPKNMQWLTKRAHKAKTRREASMCLKPKRSKS